MKTVSRAMVTVAAASMAFAPIAAQANTRANDSAPAYSANSASQPGTAREAEGEELRGTPGILIALLGAAAAIGGIIALADDESDDRSPGT